MNDIDRLDYFDVGDTVSFNARGMHKTGTIVRFFKSVLDGSSYAAIEVGKVEWHMPLKMLKLVQSKE